jgi:hypothetical protein
MGLEAVWKKCAYAGYQVWTWLSYEVSVHPFVFLGAVIVIVSAFILYKTEVRGR